MIRTFVVPAALVMVSTACVTTPRQAPAPTTTPPSAAAPPAASSVMPASQPAFEPVGTFNFSADVQGTASRGTIVVERSQDGRLTGNVTSDRRSAPLNTVDVDGRTMRLTMTLPTGPDVTFVMNFDGDSFTGTWSAQGASGSLSGARKKEYLVKRIMNGEA